MFRTVPLSIIRSFSLYTQQWCMSYTYRFCWLLAWQAVSKTYICLPSKQSAKPVWHVPLLCVQWKTPDDGQRNCPKHVEFYSKNKFEKIVHLVWFYYKNLSRCTVTWKSSTYIRVRTTYIHTYIYTYTHTYTGSEIVYPIYKPRRREGQWRYDLQLLGIWGKLSGELHTPDITPPGKAGPVPTE